MRLWCSIMRLLASNRVRGEFWRTREASRLWRRHLTALRSGTRALRSHCTNNPPGPHPSRRVRFRKYGCQVRRYMLGSFPAAVVGHPGGLGGSPETTPASICVALRRKFGMCRKRRVAVSVCCLYCSAVSLAFTLLRSSYWRCLSVQSGQRVWPVGLGLAHLTQRPSSLALWRCFFCWSRPYCLRSGR